MSKIRFRRSKLNKKSAIIIIGSLFVVIVLGVFTKSYLDTNSELKKLKAEQGSNDEITKLVKEVGKYVELPVAEVPTIATVSDTEVLKDQLFFEKAQSGDKVIVYQQFGRAILYRPSEKKIIEFAPLNYN